MRAVTRSIRNADSAPGDWYVDTACIDCGASRHVAPNLIIERNGKSVFAKQRVRIRTTSQTPANTPSSLARAYGSMPTIARRRRMQPISWKACPRAPSHRASLRFQCRDIRAAALSICSTIGCCSRATRWLGACANMDGAHRIARQAQGLPLRVVAPWSWLAGAPVSGGDEWAITRIGRAHAA